MKRGLIVLVLGFITMASWAQKGSVTGIVEDSISGIGIPFANVVFFESGATGSTTGTVANEQGEFILEGLPFGAYRVMISFIGFKSVDLPPISLTASSPSISIGTVRLLPVTMELGEVEVTAMAATSTSKLDRKTYRTDDFATARGGTAVDVLNKLPSVSVDPDGVVSVRGTSNFMVYLNGKPTQIDPSILLQQIDSHSIESIDVITVPSARYDAQGKGGIINITTKRSGIEGLSVSTNFLIGGAPWGNHRDAYSGYVLNDNRYGGSLNIVFVKERLSVYGNLGSNLRNINGARTGDARLLQADGSYYHMVAGGNRPEWFRNTSASAGLDYYLSENTLLSAGYYYGNRMEGRSAFYIYHNFYGDVNKTPIDGIPLASDWVYNPNTDNRFGVFQTANIDLNHTFDNDGEIKLSLLYEHTGLGRELDNFDYQYFLSEDQVGSLRRHFNQKDDTPLDGIRASLDYSRELKNGHTMGFGLQPQYLRNQGGFSYDTLHLASDNWGDYARFENAVDMTRGVYAGYLDYQGTAGKLAFMAGLRVEYTDQTMKIENPNYFSIFERETKSVYEINQLDWFPTLHLKYDLTEKDAISIAASRRINRPPTKDMAPFLYRRHYEVYVVGDPELKPEYMTNVELNYDRKIGQHTLGLTGFYRGTDNAIFRVNTVFEEENVLIRSFTNAGDIQAWGVELNANLVAGSKAKFYLGGSLFNYTIQGDVFGYLENNRSLNWSLKGNSI